MSATVEIDEFNGGGVITHGVVNLNVGSVDQPNIAVTPSTAIERGANSYVKYNRLHFLDLGDVSSISKIRIWLSSGGFKSGEAIKTNLVRVGLENYVPATIKAPSATRLVGNSMPVAEPKQGSEPIQNLGIKGSLTSTIASTDLQSEWVSDIWQWQVQTSATMNPGVLMTKEFTFKWDEELTIS